MLVVVKWWSCFQKLVYLCRGLYAVDTVEGDDEVLQIRQG